MPRHYPRGLPRRELLRIQLRDLHELLDAPKVAWWHHDVVLMDTAYSLAKEAARPKNSLPMCGRGLITTLELLVHWIDDEIANETGQP